MAKSKPSRDGRRRRAKQAGETAVLTRVISKQTHLSWSRAAEGIGGESWLRRVEPGFSARHFKQTFQLLGVRTFAPHPRTKTGIVQASAANVANAVKNFFLLQRAMKRQPLLEKRR